MSAEKTAAKSIVIDGEELTIYPENCPDKKRSCRTCQLEGKLLCVPRPPAPEPNYSLPAAALNKRERHFGQSPIKNNDKEEDLTMAANENPEQTLSETQEPNNPNLTTEQKKAIAFEANEIGFKKAAENHGLRWETVRGWWLSYCRKKEGKKPSKAKTQTEPNATQSLQIPLEPVRPILELRLNEHPLVIYDIDLLLLNDYDFNKLWDLIGLIIRKRAKGHVAS